MNNKKKYLVSANDFSSFGLTSDFLEKKIAEFNLQYTKPEQGERDEILLKICKYLFENQVIEAGKHRKDQWEDGWKENLDSFIETESFESIVPKYFDKYPVQRIKGELITPLQDDFEIKLVSLIQYAIFEKYFRNSKSVYEFGAGTGHNLLRLRELNKEAKLHSMEWAESGVKLINLVAKKLGDQNLQGKTFDYFNPDYSLDLEQNSSIYTFASLEQLGDNTDAIIEYWIKNKPEIVVNIEPMAEPLDGEELLQFLSIKYFEKRKYLKDYILKLKKLEESEVIKIHETHKTGFGSLFIEGYSVIAWSPLN
jgi:hypothetical protein